MKPRGSVQMVSDAYKNVQSEINNVPPTSGINIVTTAH